MYKLNQIPEAAKEDRRKGELLIEKLQQILSDDDFFNKCRDLKREYEQNTHTSNIGHVQFIQQLVDDISNSDCISIQMNEWLSEARIYVDRGI